MSIVQQNAGKGKKKLKIDPEFRDKIPPLTPEEFEQLKENILRDGEVYEPIITWNDTIIDGHHRWRIICENWELLQDKYTVRAMEFPDKWAAIEWVCKKQLGRRNLTDEERTVLIGKMYQARKKSNGGQGGNRYTVLQVGQNDPPVDKPRSTAEAIAKEVGVAEPTVKRAERFAKGMDKLQAVSPEAAKKVLKGNSGVAKKEIMAAREMDNEQVEKLAADIISGAVKERKPPATPPAKAEPTLSVKESYPLPEPNNSVTTESIISEMLDADHIPADTLEWLLEEIAAGGREYVSVLKSTLKERSALLTAENKPVVADAIAKIIEAIRDVERLVRA